MIFKNDVRSVRRTKLHKSLFLLFFRRKYNIIWWKQSITVRQDHYNWVILIRTSTFLLINLMQYSILLSLKWANKSLSFSIIFIIFLRTPIFLLMELIINWKSFYAITFWISFCIAVGIASCITSNGVKDYSYGGATGGSCC